jgi:heme/copper-type cytochrome/quinol oxidase subunit 3
MRKPIEDTGFTPSAEHPLGTERRTIALAELVAIATLALSTIVVATVVSAGIAHANVADGVIGHEGSLFGIALLLGLIFIGVSGVSVLPGRRPKKH